MTSPTPRAGNLEERLAAVLADHEPGRLNRDRYDYWRRHCAGCAWAGSPWETRDQATAEHRRHVAAELATALTTPRPRSGGRPGGAGSRGGHRPKATCPVCHRQVGTTETGKTVWHNRPGRAFPHCEGRGRTPITPEDQPR